MKKVLSVLLALTMLVSCFVFGASAASETKYKPGTYDVSASFSAYIDAMGGQEFGAKVFKGAKVVVDNNGDAKMTVSFGKGTVNIYSVKCDVFVDHVLSSKLGYYDKSGKLHTDAAYTVSKDTAAAQHGTSSNSVIKQDTYVTSMTFPLEYGVKKMNLYLYINSQVMGVQFCDGKGSAGSNEPGKATSYKATLTINSDIPTQSFEVEDSSNGGGFFDAIKRFFDSILNFFRSLFGAK